MTKIREMLSSYLSENEKLKEENATLKARINLLSVEKARAEKELKSLKELLNTGNDVVVEEPEPQKTVQQIYAIVAPNRGVIESVETEENIEVETEPKKKRRRKKTNTITE